MPTRPSTPRCTPPRKALARQVKPIGNGLFIDFPRAAQDIIEADPDDRVYYMVSTPPGAVHPRQPQAAAAAGASRAPRLGQPYFYDGSMGEGKQAASTCAWPRCT